MKTLSLFSGIGAHDLGLQRAGMEIVGQIEIDEYCQGILKKHWPQVPKWKDITSVSGTQITTTCGAIELITGGFPCQDISVAGKQKGIGEGTKSGLWREVLRLVTALRPHWVLIENVPALRTKGADTILAALEEAEYTCWSFVVGAWAVGAPHRRNRVFIVANSNSQHLRQQPRGSGRAKREGKTIIAEPNKELANTTSTRFKGCKLSKETWEAYRFPASPNQQQYEWEQPRAIKSEMGRSTDGTARRLALKALGNSNPPQILEAIGRAILQTNKT